MNAANSEGHYLCGAVAAYHPEKKKLKVQVYITRMKDRTLFQNQMSLNIRQECSESDGWVGHETVDLVISKWLQENYK